MNHVVRGMKQSIVVAPRHLKEKHVQVRQRSRRDILAWAWVYVWCGRAASCTRVTTPSFLPQLQAIVTNPPLMSILQVVI